MPFLCSYTLLDENGKISSFTNPLNPFPPSVESYVNYMSVTKVTPLQTCSQGTAAVVKFVGPEPAFGVSWQDIRRIRLWLVNQHWICWQGLGGTQKETRVFISGPYLGAKARILSFNRTQSRALTGLLTRRNTLRSHLHLTWLSDSPLCRRFGAEDETSAHIFVSVKFWLHSDTCIWAPSWSQRTLRE
jgi:hypothetical protein